MPSSYHYKLNGEESGPVTFRELVILVRDEAISADDLVKAEWEETWHPAAEVVGLFHTAGREDVLAIWQAQQREKLAQTSAGAELDIDDLDAMLETAEAISEGPEHWQQKLIEAENRKLDEARKAYDQKRGEREFDQTQDGIEVSISAAVDAAERKEQKALKRKFLADLFTKNTLHLMFRWGFAIIVANLVAYSIFNWSQKELQRYPVTERSAAEQKIFPYYGRCSPGEFLFLLVDTMILTGAVGYGGARILESMADD